MPSPRPVPRSSRSRSGDRRNSRPRPREHDRATEARWRRELDADLMAMGRVWQMLRNGAVRMLGEIGRQY